MQLYASYADNIIVIKVQFFASEKLTQLVSLQDTKFIKRFAALGAFKGYKFDSL